MGLRTKKLKQLCIQRRGSPIIYADSLPHSIPNHVTSKHTYRGQISEADAEAHITRVFSHRQLIDRVQLVIMSGLHQDVFNHARDAIADACTVKAIPVIHLPFFYGTNTPRIQAQLTAGDRTIINSIYERFQGATTEKGI